MVVPLDERFVSRRWLARVRGKRIGLLAVAGLAAYEKQNGEARKSTRFL